MDHIICCRDKFSLHVDRCREGACLPWWCNWSEGCQCVQSHWPTKAEVERCPAGFDPLLKVLYLDTASTPTPQNGREPPAQVTEKNNRRCPLLNVLKQRYETQKYSQYLSQHHQRGCSVGWVPQPGLFSAGFANRTMGVHRHGDALRICPLCVPCYAGIHTWKRDDQRRFTLFVPNWERKQGNREKRWTCIWWLSMFYHQHSRLWHAMLFLLPAQATPILWYHWCSHCLWAHL